MCFYVRNTATIWEKRLEDVNVQPTMQPPLGAQEVLTIGKQLQRKDYFVRLYWSTNSESFVIALFVELENTA